MDKLPTTRQEKTILVRAYFPDATDKAVRNMVDGIESSERDAIAADRIKREASKLYTQAQLDEAEERGRKDAYDAGFDNAARVAYQSLSGYFTQEQVDEAVREELTYWADFFSDPSMNGMTSAERLRKRIEQLTT